ncbi:hypothetical protein PFAG_02761 [Plasmodium falciparum Santa Lucia]|uniref:Beta-Casp domain-containing protein n=4 Tax=Plasmodium falciparum TaxID=5833 RepID=A0A024W6X6_PLAFA|nr:hypothetical protein PFTANZ_02827 [Plasmodium falciparum Tanzania (2000708)]EUR72069.1 hypothetical protein PFBG_02848 [Plasmodium falciparum 7G8]EUT85728.1 hypothetical protein PFAG_02761 [Plasmodium falciparum Santa Lucia]KOB60876.1 hypothetical protein PFHG_02660 [Plasmodium falciparum HB3]
MIDTFEITKLCFSEHMSSHLIKMGSYNILCDVPLDMNEILEIRETIPKEINKTNVILDNNNNNNDEYSSYNSDNRHNDGYINISNLETSPGLSKKLLLNISYIPMKIHIILISCVEGFMGLPILCKYLDFRDTHIICTKPVFTFSMCAVECLQKQENYIPEWDDEKINIKNMDTSQIKNEEYFHTKWNFKNSLHLLSYKENVSFKQYDEILNITLCSSGHSLGSSNFFLSTDYLNIFIVNKSSYNIKRHTSSFDSSMLNKCNFVIFTSFLLSKQLQYYVDQTDPHYNSTSCSPQNNVDINHNEANSNNNQTCDNNNNKKIFDNNNKKKTCDNNNKKIFDNNNNNPCDNNNNNPCDNNNNNPCDNNNNNNNPICSNDQATHSPKSSNTTQAHNMKQLILQKIQIHIEKSYKDSLNKICSLVLKTIKNKGCVLIPVDLHFLYFIELIELIGVIISKHLPKEEQVLIFSVLSNIQDVIHQLNLFAEWVEESRKKKCSKILNPQGPFSIDIMIKNNRLIIGNNINDITKQFRYPCVCFIHDSSLRFFESSLLLEKWANEQNNTLILVDPFYDPIKVLYPFKIYEKKINVHYCPLSWDLNEFHIKDIIMSNTKNVNVTKDTSHKNINNNINNNINSNINSNINNNINSNINNNINNDINNNKSNSINNNDTHVCVYILPETSKHIFTDIYQMSKNELPLAYQNVTIQKDNNNYNNHNNHIDIDQDTFRNILFIQPFEKKQIAFDKFENFNQKMIPVRFSPGETKKLERILKKVDDFFCANIKAHYTCSFIGDYIDEDHIEEFKVDELEGQNKYEIINDEQHDISNEQQIKLMVGSINVDVLTSNLLHSGYNKNDILVEYQQNQEKDTDTNNNVIWSITINSIKSKIICHDQYDIEVCTNNIEFREKVKEIFYKLVNHIIE